MCVSVVRVEDLGFAYLLQGSASFEYDFNWHFVENLILCARVICQVHHSLDRANFGVGIGPFMNGGCNLLYRSPVNKNFVFTFGRVVTKLILLHPIAHFPK